MFDAQIWAFIGVALVLTITPGADTMLVLRSDWREGSAPGCWPPSLK
jgi:threonine/homoserine/homoserine lactone efflux protein